MLGSKKPSTPATAAPQKVQKPTDKIDTLIGPQTEFTGDVVFSGGLRIDGRVTGNITARDAGNGCMLTITERGEVKGNVTVPHVLINGMVNGNVSSTGKVVIQGQARIIGDVHYAAIEMELGATVNGSMVCETAKKNSFSAASKPSPSVTGEAPAAISANAGK
jgi:cytoskeletal protein CcmA (bactofilin family)